MTLNEIDESPETLGDLYANNGYAADNLDAESTRLQGIIDALIEKHCGDDELLREQFVLAREIDVAEILTAFGRQPTLAEWDRSGWIGLQGIAASFRKCEGCDQWERDVEKCRVHFNEHAGAEAGKWRVVEYCGGCIDATRWAISINDPDTIDEIERLSVALAKAFARVLHEWLGADKVEEVAKRNDAEPDKNICHSHDFCDANEAMDEAFRTVVGRGVDMESAEDMALWRGAWDLAIRRRFSVSQD